MNLKRKRISILSNLLSGIGIITLGIIVVVGSIKLYTIVISLLVYIFLIFGLSNLINFLFNKKVVRNRQTLILIVLNIVFGIIMLIFPKISLSFIPILFSLYLLLHSIIKFIDYILLKRLNSRLRFRDLFLSIFFLVFSYIFLCYPTDKLNLFIMIIGIYCIILGISKIYDFFMDILSSKTKFKIRKRVKMTLPLFFEAFLPKRALKSINKYINSILNEAKDKQDDADLKIFIHLSNYGFNQFGHIDLIIEDKIYSYGNYDKMSRSLFNALGDGVLFITNKKEEYIDFCMSKCKETIIEYGISVSKEDIEKLNENIGKILEYSYKWDPKINYKKTKKLNYAHKVYNATKAKFYKFSDGKFKTFFVLGTNCTYFIDVILGNCIFESLKLVGVISPGTYYEYLEENYKNKNSNVVYRKIYTKDSNGDLDVKNKK